jgi:hypothetical protein
MNQAIERRWIGYDWFKLIVALILAALLLLFRPVTRTETTAVTPATSPPAVATVAASAQLAAPVLTSPAPGTQAAPGPVAFRGTAAPGVEVQLLVDGAPAGKTRTDADGTWTLNTTLDKPSAHQVVVQALDGMELSDNRKDWSTRVYRPARRRHNGRERSHLDHRVRASCASRGAATRNHLAD